AQDGSDYSLYQNAYFDFGQTTTTVEFEIFDDGELEGTETVELQLLNFSGSPDIVFGNQDSVSLEILDNEVSYIEFAENI
ncbi:hypothetical protein Xen7305DRAFT_00028340, partial [Xenococcus sp. PCC 7305]|uniref:hypothetical protein n=1 Tax=Xenococcus sp. PCC 7305 TaxID=102125 RepID=UPI0002AC757C